MPSKTPRTEEQKRLYSDYLQRCTVGNEAKKIYKEQKTNANLADIWTTERVKKLAWKKFKESMEKKKA